MKILVTGGGGFIGSHTVDLLLEKGNTVAVLDSLVAGSTANLASAAQFFQSDVRDDVSPLIERFRPDAICHLAAQVDVRRSVESPALDANVNILGTVNLLDAAIRHGVRRFVFASSGGAIYGPDQRLPAKEGDDLRPSSPYGLSKAAAERYIDFYRVQYGLETVTLRYSNVYGPRQELNGEAGVVAILASRLLRGTKPTIYGDGGQTRDFVYVGDVARANLIALTDEVPSGVYNIGTGIETSINELYRIVAEALGADPSVEYEPARVGEQRRSAVDPTLAASVLRWRPEMRLQDGIRATVESISRAGGSR